MARRHDGTSCSRRNRSGVAVGGLASIAEASPAGSTANSLRFEPVAPGVWKATAGTPEDLTLLTSAGVAPKVDGLRALPETPFPLPPNQLQARVANGKVALRFPLALDEDVYGLGVDFTSDPAHGRDVPAPRRPLGRATGRTHAPVPLYVSTQGLRRVLRHGAVPEDERRAGVRLAARAEAAGHRPHDGQGLAVAAAVRFGRGDRARRGHGGLRLRRADADGRRPPLQPVLRRRRAAAEVGAGLPRPHADARTAPSRRSTKSSSSAKNGIPLDMLGLEPGWHDHAYPCSFEWDKTRFPDPAAFLNEVEQQHVRVEPLVQPVRLADRAAVQEAAAASPARTSSGTASCPTTRMPEARKIFCRPPRREGGREGQPARGRRVQDRRGGRLRPLPLARHGDVPLRPRRRAAAPDLRAARAAAASWTSIAAQNRRTMGQVRGTNGGASPFPFVIYNDNYDFDEYMTAVANSGVRRRALVARGARRRRRSTCCAARRPSASRRWRSSTAGRARRSSGRTPT